MSDSDARSIAPAPTKDEIMRELIAARTDHLTPLGQAREKWTARVLEDLDFWYEQAKQIALKGTGKDQTRAYMIGKVLDKVCPDRRENLRGGGAGGPSTLIQVNAGTRGTQQAYDAAVRARDAPRATITVEAANADGNGRPPSD